MSAAGPPQGTRPLGNGRSDARGGSKCRRAAPRHSPPGGTARSDARGDQSAAGPPQGTRPLGGTSRSDARGDHTSVPTASDIRTRIVAGPAMRALAIAVTRVDSMTPAHASHGAARVRGRRCITQPGPRCPRRPAGVWKSMAARHGWPLVLLDAFEQADARYRANPVDRCYYCKSNLYARIGETTSDPIASGTNCDDLTDFRPGLRGGGAQCRASRCRGGDRQDGVYALAADLGLDDLERLPAQPCLASRVETGIAIALETSSCVDRHRSTSTASTGASTGATSKRPASPPSGTTSRRSRASPTCRARRSRASSTAACAGSSCRTSNPSTTRAARSTPPISRRSAAARSAPAVRNMASASTTGRRTCRRAMPRSRCAR